MGHDSLVEIIRRAREAFVAVLEQLLLYSPFFDDLGTPEDSFSEMYNGDRQEGLE